MSSSEGTDVFPSCPKELITLSFDETSIEKTGLLRGGWLHWQMLGLKEGTEEDCSGELKKG